MYSFKTVGPFGGSGVTDWGDGVRTDARAFRISFDKATKASRIEYNNNGSFVLPLEPGKRGKGHAGIWSTYHPRPENIYPEGLLRAVHSGITAKVR